VDHVWLINQVVREELPLIGGFRFCEWSNSLKHAYISL